MTEANEEMYDLFRKSSAAFVVKYGLLMFNLLFVLASAVLTIVGAAAVYVVHPVGDLTDTNVASIFFGLLIVGTTTLIVSFSGCCAVIKESRWLLVIYATSMAVLAGVKVYLVVELYKIIRMIPILLQAMVVEIFMKKKNAFNLLEITFQCCGTSGVQSYNTTNLPTSCCTDPVKNSCPADSSFEGCCVRISNYFTAYSHTLGVGVIIVIVIEIIATVSALYLTKTITNTKRIKQ